MSKRPIACSSVGDQLRVAVAEVVRAAVEVQVDQPPARHVPEQVALAAVDHEVDAGVLPEVRSCQGSRTPRDLVEDSRPSIRRRRTRSRTSAST
jgi:hypothetical protein